jgi:N6-adenosine-specific RNA methylase IME4
MSIAERAIAARNAKAAHPRKAWGSWPRQIADCWRKSAKAIIETGRLIARAKAALEHGEFMAMIETALPFSAGTAERLMAIAADSRLTNSAHGPILPPHWRTMYELTKLDDREFKARVKDGTINSEMERGDIATIVKKENRDRRERELGEKQQALPAQKFGVILADPEWQFEPWSRETGMSRAADNHYPTSVTEVIASRPVEKIAANDCVLFLWATAPMLPQALLVMSAWGFDYKTEWVWHKVRPGKGRGTGYWVTGEHEPILIGTRGKVPAPATAMCRSIIAAPIGKHSAKPEQFAEIIERTFPTLPKIELNRRGAARPGWTAWGNEATP